MFGNLRRGDPYTKLHRLHKLHTLHGGFDLKNHKNPKLHKLHTLHGHCD